MEWKPMPGTLPGKTEMRVLRALKRVLVELAFQPTSDELHAYIDNRGWEHPGTVYTPEDGRWHPSASTVHNRLQDAQTRGWARAVDHGWDLTRSGKTLLNRLAMWEADRPLESTGKQGRMARAAALAERDRVGA